MPLVGTTEERQSNISCVDVHMSFNMILQKRG